MRFVPLSALLIFLALALAFSARPAPAQQRAPYGPRVRVTRTDVPGEKLIGRLAGLDPDTIALSIGGAATITLETRRVELLELSRGHDRLAWVRYGAMAGLLGGGMVGALSTAGGYEIAPIAGFVVGATFGLPLGAMIGGLAAPETWVNYPLPREKW